MLSPASHWAAMPGPDTPATSPQRGEKGPGGGSCHHGFQDTPKSFPFYIKQDPDRNRTLGQVPCGQWSRPGLLAEGEGAGCSCPRWRQRCLRGSHGCEEHRSRSGRRVVAGAGGRASFTAPKVGLGRRRRHSNSRGPARCQPGVEEAARPAVGKVLPCSSVSPGGLTDCLIDFRGWGRGGETWAEAGGCGRSIPGAALGWSEGWRWDVVPDPR